MRIAQQLLSDPLFQALGWALIHFLWQGALVALLLMGLKIALRRASPNARYAAACLALIIMLALPAATMLKIANAPLARAERTQRVSSDIAAIKNEKAVGVAIAQEEFNQPAEIDQSQNSLRPLSAWVAGWKEYWTSERLQSLLPWLVSVWLLGVVLLSLRVMGGWLIAQRFKRQQAARVAEVWQDTVTRLATRLKVKRPVRLCASAVAEVPTVIGWLRPVILVPASALTGLTPEGLEALLAHELAHIKRHDYLVNLLQTVVETLLFYHPAVWWVSNQIRMEREHACDDLAVAACGDVLTYARALADLEELRARAVPQFALAASGGSLAERIRRLIEKPAPSAHQANAWLASALALVTVFCIWSGTRTTLFASEKSERRETVKVQSALEAAPKTRDDVAVENSDQQTSRPLVIKDTQPVVVEVKPAANETTMASATPSDAASTPQVAVAPVITQTPVLNETTPAPAAQEKEESGSYIDQLAALGYTNLSVDQLIEMHDHGVSPRLIRELKSYGYTNLSVEQLVRFADHGVSASFIKGLSDLGFKKVSPDELVRARDHGVTPDFIEGIQAAGYRRLSLDELIETRDHGVTPTFIKEMVGLGFDNLTLDMLVRMRDHGVTPDYVRGIERAGYTKLTAEQLIRLRDHGVTPSYIERVRARGITNLSLEDLVRLRDSGIF